MSKSTSKRYYVFVIDDNFIGIDGEGPYGPFDLKTAKQYARIGATKAKRNNRAVSRGKNSCSESFRLLYVYSRGTGEKILG